jgi:DNA-binding transcriptional MocR family regulator
MEALNLCLESVTRPGDLIAIESPTFYAALQAVERLGLRVVEVATHPRTGVDLSSLSDVLSRHDVKACWFMTNFQNPLGSLVPDSQKRELVEILARRDVPLIEDDVYSEIYFGSRRPLHAKAFDKRGLVMHCSSFSKSLAPGYRVGWVAAGRYAEEISKRKLSTSLSAAVPSQEGLCEYLSHSGFDRHLRQLRRTLASSLAAMARTVTESFPDDIRVTRPEGGYFLWIEMPEHVDALTVHRLALSHGIGVAPGHIFSADRRFTNCLRLNFGHAGDARSPEAVRTLGQIVRSLS